MIIFLPLVLRKCCKIILIHNRESITNKTPVKSTSGGTSDARFIKDICSVIEFGLVGKLMHKIDEKVSIKEIHELEKIYRSFLNIYFNIKND